MHRINGCFLILYSSKARYVWSVWQLCRASTTTENSTQDWSSSLVASRSAPPAGQLQHLKLFLNSHKHWADALWKHVWLNWLFQLILLTKWLISLFTGPHRLHDSWQRVWRRSTSNQTTHSGLEVSGCVLDGTWCVCMLSQLSSGLPHMSGM